MRDMYEKLWKILALEQSRNFNDTAVIGGLEGFLAFWLSEARSKAGDATARQKVEEVAARLHGYSGQDAGTRRANVLYLMERLGGRAESAPVPQAPRAEPKPPPPARRESKPVPPQREPERPARQARPERQAEPERPTPRAEAPRPEPEPQTRATEEIAEVEQVEEVAAPQSRQEEAEVVEAQVERRVEAEPVAGPRPFEGQKPLRERREIVQERRDRAPAPAERKWTRPASTAREMGLEEATRLDKELDQFVTTLPGIGASKAARLERLGIRTVRDLLFHAPSRYEDYTTMRQIAELMYGDEVTIAGVVQQIDLFKSQRGAIVVTGMVTDGTGAVQVRWFGNRYLVNQLRPGTTVRLSGKVDAYLGRLQMTSPRHEIVDVEEVHSGRLVPVYPLTEGVSEKALARDVTVALEQTRGRIPDPLPAELRNQFDLIDLPLALQWLHQPEEIEQAKAAKRRLAFDELLRLQLGMLEQRRRWREQTGQRIVADPAVLERFRQSLPFELTEAQRRARDEILTDMAEPYTMSRLLQGDVGSGKTVVAAEALLAAVSAGFQGALMAPTEILAEQHVAGLRRFLNPESEPLLGNRLIEVALLTGSMAAGEKQAVRAGLAAGQVDVVVGTHALIQDGIEFANLGLVIVDEQHRFGVQQRSALKSRTPNGTPDVLVMSATPIPRSLALTLYGDLDLSIIDEMPPGRQPIVTRAITPAQRERAYTYIRRQVIEGRQAFVICPLVEESDKLEARAAVEEHRFLQQEVFPDFQVGLLHGRLRSEEKEAEMARFYRNETQVLVSTSVVEVGIDVPNASVMLIEGANRFGLAQLHQFRGRIGRGQWRSLCLLMAEDEVSSDGEQRLNAVVENADGFALAEEDLRMRGPGDFFGTRQSGLPELKMAKLGDTQTLVRARDAAQRILDLDPTLARPEHQLLREQTRRYWAAREGDLS
jgi:ATP-dependent DNA helicase RecG